MLNDRLMHGMTGSSDQRDGPNRRECCTPLDRTFAGGLILVFAIVGACLYVALYSGGSVRP